MTVSESIIEWMQGFSQTDIDIDSLGSVSMSYGLFRAPVSNITKDILGNKTYTDHYTYMVRLDNLSDADMIDNQSYMSGLTDWIEEQDNIKNYPSLSNANCIGVSVSTPAYMGYTEERTAIYQMTISIKYRKEHNNGKTDRRTD